MWTKMCMKWCVWMNDNCVWKMISYFEDLDWEIAREEKNH